MRTQGKVAGALRFGFGLGAVVFAFVACGGSSSTGADAAGGSSEAGTSAGSPKGGAAPAAGTGGAVAAGGSTAGATSGGTATAGDQAGGRAGAGGLTTGGAGGVTTGGAGGQGTGGQSVVTTPEALKPIIDAFCATARGCCAANSEPAMLDDCETSYAQKNKVLASLMSGALTFVEADLQACLAAYKAAATGCEQVPVLAACTGISHGTRAQGASCTMGLECAGNEAQGCLITENGGTVGKCFTVPHGKAGDLCVSTCRLSDRCDVSVYGKEDSRLTQCFETDGVYCDYQQAAAGQCQPIRATGAACSVDDQCGSEGYCDLSGSKTCKKRGKLNEACGMCIPSLMCKDGKCQSPPLTVGAVCDGYSPGPY